MGLAKRVKDGVSSKKFTFYAIGIGNYNRYKLSSICPTEAQPISLAGLKFSEFFKWLSNSISAVTKTTNGEMVNLPSTSLWGGQVTM